MAHHFHETTLLLAQVRMCSMMKALDLSTAEDYMGHWVGHSQKHFVVAVYDDVNQQKISLYPKDINGYVQIWHIGTNEF